MERETRTVELTVETSETVTLNRHRKMTVALCTTCGSRMLAPEDAANLVHLSRRQIYRAIETGDAHFVEQPDVGLFVCIGSLKGVSK